MAESSQAKPKKGGSSFVMIAAFLFVLLIMFDNNLRIATGAFVGNLFNPVATLWGENILWTLVFAGVVMILLTTVIRHFLVDWVQMARVQEIMRTFQKEFATARKSNNTYQVKRLTDMQPEIMKLQADMSSAQLKPMAFTMLLVIPIFAYLSTITAAPVVYAMDLTGATEPVLLVATGPDAQGAVLVSDRSEGIPLLHASELHVVALGGSAPTGTLTLEHPNTGRRIPVDLSSAEAVDWSRYSVGNLGAGSYFVRPEGDPKVGFTVEDDGHATLSHIVVALPRGGDASSAVATFVDGNGAYLNLTEASDVYAVIPMAMDTAPTGAIKDTVRAAGSDEIVATWDVTVEGHLLSTDAAGAPHVVPHSARLPWNQASDLNGSWWVLPHWILVYSLFSIPIGTLTQKVLKLIEYSKVDLDADGKAPGLQVE